MNKIINPKKYIRKAIIDALPNYEVFDTSVPIDKPYPNQYITIDNMNLSPTEESKTCYEWNLDATINIWKENVKGFVSSASVEDMEEDLINAKFNASPFMIKSVKLIESKPLNVGNVSRIVVMLRFWLNLEKNEYIINAMPYNEDKEIEIWQ